MRERERMRENERKLDIKREVHTVIQYTNIRLHMINYNM